VGRKLLRDLIESGEITRASERPTDGAAGTASREIASPASVLVGGRAGATWETTTIASRSAEVAERAVNQ